MSCISGDACSSSRTSGRSRVFWSSFASRFADPPHPPQGWSDPLLNLLRLNVYDKSRSR
jgi:hypothetical protein